MNRRPVLSVVWCLVVLLVAGCSGAAGTGSGVAGPATGPATGQAAATGETARFEAARQEWTAAGIRDYELVVDRVCFCEVSGPVTFAVRGGVAVSTRFVAAAGGPTPTATPQGLPTTVPDLFTTLESLLASAEKITVTYGEHGVPTSIVSEGKLNTFDDEVTYTVQFTPAAAGTAGPGTPPASPTSSAVARPTSAAPLTSSPTVATSAPAPVSSSAAALARQLTKARAAWAAAGIRDYDLVVRRACFCEGGDVLVSVRGATPVKAVLLPEHASYFRATAVRPDTPRTVEALFAIVAQKRPATEKFVVSFGGYGVPTRIESDPSAAYDDERTLTMTFTRARPGQPPSTALPTTPPPPTGAPSSTAVPSSKPSVQGSPGAVAPTSLADARRVWAAAGVRDYTLQIARACFCAYRGTVEVTVRAGRAAGMRMLPLAGGAEPGPIPPDTPATVEALLDLVATEQRTADKVTVTFDRYGVPVRIVSDRIANAVDDEMSYMVTFKPA